MTLHKSESGQLCDKGYTVVVVIQIYEEISHDWQEGTPYYIIIQSKYNNLRQFKAIISITVSLQ